MSVFCVELCCVFVCVCECVSFLAKRSTFTKIKIKMLVKKKVLKNVPDRCRLCDVDSLPAISIPYSAFATLPVCVCVCCEMFSRGALEKAKNEQQQISQQPARSWIEVVETPH